jgi:hypothetical protein
MGVWAVAPRFDGVGCGAQLNGLGVCSPPVHHEHRLSLSLYIYIYIYHQIKVGCMGHAFAMSISKG